MLITLILICLQVLAKLTDCHTAEDRWSIQKSLYDALYKNNTEEVIKLVEDAKKQLNVGDIFHSLEHDYYFGTSATAVFIAVKMNNIEVVKLLVSLGANINEYSSCKEKTDPPPVIKTDYDSVFCSVLGMAVKKNSTDLVKFLLEKGATDNQVGIYTDFKTAYHYAVDNNNADMIRLIAEYKSNIDISSSYPFFTPLYYTVEKGNIRMVQVLLESGANVTKVTGGHSFSVLHGVVELKQNQKQMTKLLLKNGANLEQKSREGMTPLDWAVCAYYHKPLDLFLKFHAFAGRYGESRYLLSNSYQTSKEKLLAEQGPDLRRKRPEEMSPEDKAVLYSSPWTALNLFVELGSVVNVTLLVEAINNADYETARILYNGKYQGSIGNVLTKSNLTSWHLAMILNDLEVLKTQKSTSETIETKDRNGDTPLLIAVKNDFYQGVEVLVEKGANLDIQDSKGRTPIFISLEKKQLSILKYLYTHGADIDHIKCKYGCTTSTYAKVLFEKSIQTIIKEGFS